DQMRTLAAIAVVVAILPMLRPAHDLHMTSAPDRPWPEPFASYQRLPITDLEQRFAEAASTKIAHFQEGDTKWLLRWIGEPSRNVHPPEHCFRGSGWTVRPLPGRALPLPGTSTPLHWTCSEARREQHVIEVCNVIVDDTGRSWGDVGSWWWTAKFQNTQGPWLSVVRMKTVDPINREK
ncbi:MAG TPA: hypothetical protein VE621_08920, partial [Bryobacteraceae bacterium]|nr:hypothetical protein [Bryobacteraceae bacterium]